MIASVVLTLWRTWMEMRRTPGSARGWRGPELAGSRFQYSASITLRSSIHAGNSGEDRGFSPLVIALSTYIVGVGISCSGALLERDGVTRSFVWGAVCIACLG